MTRITNIRCERVRFIPSELENGTIYVSDEFATAVHLCCCGCGNKVVTPISPTDWQIKLSKGEVSLYPSIGNWSFPCQSHYWIKHGRVIRAERMSRQQIDRGRALDRIAKEKYFASEKPSPWRRFVTWFFGGAE